VAAAGIVVSIRQMRSRKGARWAILSLQDPTGIIEALVFPEAFSKLELILKTGAMLLVRGRVAVEDAGTRLVASDGKLLEDVAEPPAALLRIRFDRETATGDFLDALSELLNSSPGVCGVELEVPGEDGSIRRVQSSQHVRADRSLIDQLRELCGAEAVEVIRESSRAAAGSSYN
jgi:DNA polymerase III subunit alpha